MTPEPYDPSNPKTWPEEQLQLATQAGYAILDRNLQPLADYLRAGHQLTPFLADIIADAIEGKNTPVRVKAMADRRGRKKRSESVANHYRSMQIGVFMEVRAHELGRGGYDAALAETCSRFSITPTAVKSHHKLARDEIGPRDEFGYDWVLERFRRVYVAGEHPF